LTGVYTAVFLHRKPLGHLRHFPHPLAHNLDQLGVALAGVQLHNFLARQNQGRAQFGQLTKQDAHVFAGGRINRRHRCDGAQHRLRLAAAVRLAADLSEPTETGLARTGKTDTGGLSRIR